METPALDLNRVDIRWDNLDWPKFLGLSVACNVFVKTAIYPTVVAKTRIQVTHTQNGEYQSASKMMRAIGSAEGLRGLYRGFGTAMLGFVIPQSAYIYVYEKTRDYIHKRLSKDASPGTGGTHSATFLANTLGGACAAIISTTMNTPVDVISQRLQLQGPSSTVASHHYRGGLNAFYVISQVEGIRGLYRGLGATLTVFVPSSAIWWAVNGSLRRATYPLVHDKGVVAETAGSIVCGVFSGWASIALLNPLDVAKTRLQTQEQKPGNPKNIFTMAWTILRNEGVTSIWLKGLTARMTGTAFFSSWTTVMYELVKKWSYIDSRVLP